MLEAVTFEDEDSSPDDFDYQDVDQKELDRAIYGYDYDDDDEDDDEPLHEFEDEDYELEEWAKKDEDGEIKLGKEEVSVCFPGVNGEVVVTAWVDPDPEPWRYWCRTIRVRAMHGSKQIGYALGRYVMRERIQGDWEITKSFYECLDEPSSELSKFARTILDHTGDLKREWIDLPGRKGTGCWGRTLDLEDLIFVEEIFVDTAWRRKGIGKLMYLELDFKANDGPRWAAQTFVIPGFSTVDICEGIEHKSAQEKREIKRRSLTTAIEFFRALRFRRIGLSSCFARSIEPTFGNVSLDADRALDEAAFKINDQ